MRALAKDPRYQFPEGDKGRAEIRAFIDDRLAWIRAQMPRAFKTLVNPNMEVRRLPPEEEPGAPAAYGGPGSIDGKIPGRFWINLRTTALHSRYSLADLTFHEAIPGHVWQGEYTHRMPLIRQLLSFNAYSEGWALYAEQLADELGAYDDFPVGRLGYVTAFSEGWALYTERLADEMGLYSGDLARLGMLSFDSWRACRLVVDTGIHHLGWSRSRAIDYLLANSALTPGNVENEVDRYIADPGQALAYMVGRIELQRLRGNARPRLGGRFDIKAFHDTVLGTGGVPLPVLAQEIDRWVAEGR